MKLYYSPGSCSLASHIVLREADLPHELIRVDIKHDKTTADGRNFNSINPKGYVPALELDNGIVLSEGAAIMQFLAEQRPQSGLLPPAGSVERAQVQGWLNFVASELHKSFSPLFNKQASDDWRAAGAEHLRRRLAYVSESLGDKPYLMGGRLCIADAYLFVILTWCKPVNIDLSRWPNLIDYKTRVGDRPAVRDAMQAEGMTRR